MPRIKLNLQKKIGKHLHTYLAYTFCHFDLDTVDLKSINNNRTEKIPYTQGGLFGNFLNWGIIDSKAKNGGTHHLGRFGLIYDSRDRESNPNTGFWSEAQFIVSPAIHNSYAFSKICLTQRQYIPLLRNKLTLAYRLSYQAKLSGEIPFYYLPVYFESTPNPDYDGLGGSRTMRGIMRNRVVGNDLLLGNIELRWNAYHFLVKGQNLDIVWCLFSDAGYITKKYPIPSYSAPEAVTFFSSSEKDGIHPSIGAGLHAVLNQNFVLTFDYARALDKRDGISGLYINIGFLF